MDALRFFVKVWFGWLAGFWCGFLVFFHFGLSFGFGVGLILFIACGQL